MNALRTLCAVLSLVILASFVSVGLGINPSQAQSLWDHNGSTVRLDAAGTTRRFYYVEPRSGLPAKSGDLLFEGQKQANTYVGNAVLFSSNCGPIKYSVSGHVADDQRAVTLQGKAPQRDTLCRTIGYRDDTLVFSYRSSPASSTSSDLREVWGDRSKGEVWAGIVFNQPGLLLLRGVKASSGDWFLLRKDPYGGLGDGVAGDDDIAPLLRGTYRRDSRAITLLDSKGREIRLEEMKEKEGALIRFSAGANTIYRWTRKPRFSPALNTSRYAMCFEDTGNEGCYDGTIYVACKRIESCQSAFRSLGLANERANFSSGVALNSNCRKHPISYWVETPIGQEASLAGRLRNHPDVIEACRYAQTAGGTDPTEIELTVEQLYGAESANAWRFRDRLETFFKERFSPDVLRITTTVPSAAKIVIGANSASFCRQLQGKWEQYVLQINVGKRHEQVEKYHVILSIADAWFGNAPRDGSAPIIERLDRLDYEKKDLIDAKLMDACRDYIASMLGVHFVSARVGYVEVYDYSNDDQ